MLSPFPICENLRNLRTTSVRRHATWRCLFPMNGESFLEKPVPAPELPSPDRRYPWLVRGLWCLVVVAVCVRVGISPHRQSSYANDYAPAGWHWLHGQEVYSQQRQFVYSPLAAAAFVPFAALSGRLGGILWRVGSVLAFAGLATAWLRRNLSGLGEVAAPLPGSPVLPTAFLLLLPLAVGNVNLGQINLLVLVLTTGGVLAVHGRRWNVAALLLAAAGFIKIYPLAIGLLLVLLYPRPLSWRLVLAVAALFLLSLGLQRPAYVWHEYQRWFAVLGNDDRLDIDLYASWRDFGFLCRACGLPLSDRAYRLLEVSAGGLLALFLWLGKQRWGWTEARLLGGTFSLGCAWMLLFGPATEHATYVVLSLPVCAALVAAWRLPRAAGQSRAVGLPGVFVVSYALLLLSEVMSAWFHASTHHLYIRAVQPVAALLFTAGMVWWLRRLPVSPPDKTASLATTQGQF